MRRTTKRYVGLGLGIAMLAPALYAATNQAETRSAGTAPCGLGLPPGAPGFDKEQGRIALEVKVNGFEKVCDANLDRFRMTFEPPGPIMPSLAFQPVDLAGTPFAQFKHLGAMIERDNRSRSRLYRGYRLPDGHTVTLFEWDMSVDGASSWRAPEDEPERINGQPARLAVFQAPSGNAISHLSWEAQRRAYELWIDANVVNTPLRDRLFALAAAIPPALPACPNEVPPKRPRFGADGLPINEPIPATLTDADIDAMSDSSKRPCK